MKILSRSLRIFEVPAEVFEDLANLAKSYKSL